MGRGCFWLRETAIRTASPASTGPEEWRRKKKLKSRASREPSYRYLLVEDPDPGRYAPHLACTETLRTCPALGRHGIGLDGDCKTWLASWGLGLAAATGGVAAKRVEVEPISKSCHLQHRPAPASSTPLSRVPHWFDGLRWWAAVDRLGGWPVLSPSSPPIPGRRSPR